MATFSVHFDGPITINHRVPIRVLANTYGYMQGAIDRAYLIGVHGEVWKHARLTRTQYEDTAFIADYPREGGIILDAVKETGGEILDRIAAAIRPVFEQASNQAVQQHQSLAQQYTERMNYVRGMRANTQTFEEVAAAPPAHWADAYSNRSVTKEIDQLTRQIASRRLEGSSVDIQLTGTRAHLPFSFTPAIAARFHAIASERELGAAFIATVRVRSIDRGNRRTRPSSKVENLATGREVTLQLHSVLDCDALRTHHNDEPVRIYVSPVVEALGFDIRGGDLMFLGLV